MTLKKIYQVAFILSLLLVYQISAQSPDFAREILPILSDKYFACHDPDTKKKELRLDSFEGAIEDLGGYQAINPKDLSESEIIVRIHDEDDLMPPDDAENQLTAKERELLTQWVKSGGKYAKHWAYVPAKKCNKHQSIDGFIKAGFTGKKVDFAKEPDKATLARRVSLVLTGLPPEPSQLKTYLADKSPQAYEKLIDQLFSNSSYGADLALLSRVLRRSMYLFSLGRKSGP
ncbi:MAG: DUF1549 domain-containing protein [Lentisphaeraceae bacterium]|nr:DUF1549 domain-containing protein [Lentisphaeraceae bacterium]